MGLLPFHDNVVMDVERAVSSDGVEEKDVVGQALSTEGSD